MGANIDYAIVVSSRYKEFRETMDRREAIISTLNVAFPTIITSGLMMVCAGLLIGFQVSQCIIAGMGYYVGTGTSISLLLILFALPQVLVLGDRFVAATTIDRDNSAVAGFFARNRRSFAAALLSLALVLAILAVPFGMLTAGSYRDSMKRYADNPRARPGWMPATHSSPRAKPSTRRAWRAITRARPSTTRATQGCRAPSANTTQARPSSRRARPSTTPASPSTTRAKPGWRPAPRSLRRARPSTMRRSPATMRARPGMTRRRRSLRRARPNTTRDLPNTTRARPGWTP